MRSTPLRVLVVGVKWPPETFLARLFRGLLARGIRVSVATNQRPEEEWLSTPEFYWFRLPNESDITWQRLRQVMMPVGRRQATAINSPTTADSWRLHPFGAESWDVLYSPWNIAAIKYLPLFDRAPVVISCRGAQINIAPHNPERNAIREGLHESFARAAAVHCVSQAIRDEATRYGLDPAKAVVINPAVDPDFFHPVDSPGSNGHEFHLITTGSLIWRKGYEYMLLAVRALIDRGVPARLTIIGEGPERPRLRYTIFDLELDSVVELTGSLAPEQVRQQLQAADAFLFTSLSEGISNAVLEAMACGMPVVSTNVGGMPEAIHDGVEGYLVPARDPAATAEALLRLWQDPALRRRLGAAGRQRISQDFILDNQVDKFAELFHRVA